MIARIPKARTRQYRLMLIEEAHTRGLQRQHQR